MKLAITGQEGFIGSHLYNTIKYKRTDIQLVDFSKDFFDNDKSIDSVLNNVDIIVHLAGVNRHNDPSFLYNQNIKLSQKILDSIKRVRFTGHLIFASSTQENDDNPYGNAKKTSRNLFDVESKKIGYNFTGLIIPNVFGPFTKPNYNSFIATFCYNSIRDVENKIIIDTKVSLIYIETLVNKIIETFTNQPKSKLEVSNETTITVSAVKNLIEDFKDTYLINGAIPKLNTKFKKDLFKTFITYIPLQDFFPKRYNLFTDERGTFAELVRTEVPGQVSFSITKKMRQEVIIFILEKLRDFL